MSQSRKTGQDLNLKPSPSSEEVSSLSEDVARFQRVFGASPIGVAVMTNRGRVLFANPAFCDLLGHALPELRMFPDHYFTHPDDRAMSRAKLAPLWKGEVSSVCFEKRLIDKSRQVHWVEFTASAIAGGTTNVPNALIHIQDITRHKQQVAERERMLRRMVKAQSMFQGLVRSVPDGLIISNSFGVITMANAHAEEMFGYSGEGLVGRPIGTLIPLLARDQWDEPPHLSNRDQDSLGIGGTHPPLAAVRKDGNQFQVDIELSSTTIEGNSHTIATVRDVTTMRRSERRLDLLGRVMRALAESFEDDLTGEVVVEALVPELADMAMLQILADDGDVDRLVAAHKDQAQLPLLQDLGLRDLESLGMRAGGAFQSTTTFLPDVTSDMLAREYMDPAHLEMMTSLNLHSVLSVPLAARDRVVGHLVIGMTDSGRRLDRDDFEFACYLASRIALEVDNYRLYISERTQRKVAESLVAGRDITLANIADGVIVGDREGGAVLVNAAARRMLGLRSDDAPSAEIDFPPLHSPDGTVEHIPVLLKEAIRQPGTLTIERVVHLPSDITRTLELVFSPLQMNDSFEPGIIVLLRDVTAARELEREKDDFIANITHDLRSPLTAIKESIAVILANLPDRFPDPLHRLLTNSEGATVRLEVMVENLLDLGQLQQDRLKHHPKPTTMGDLVNRAIDLVEPLARARGQRVVRMIDREPLVVFADATHIDRAVINLLDNAHKYGLEGGTIWVSLFKERGQAVLRVEDDGPGIDPADHHRIFDRFVRSGTEARDTVPGTGLGLPISRTLVEMEGGALQFESTLGVGSAFSIVLPLMDGGTLPVDSARGNAR